MQCVFTLMKSEERRERVLAKAVGWFPGEFQVRRGFCDRFEGRDPFGRVPAEDAKGRDAGSGAIRGFVHAKALLQSRRSQKHLI
jgi:hypothetical protein